MNLEYDLKKFNEETALMFAINNKRLTMIEFLCYMQYEYFCSFFVSVLGDITGKEKYKDVEFPTFDCASFQKTFELKLLREEKINPPTPHKEFTIQQRMKYVNIVKNGDELIFIPNRKVTVNRFRENLEKDQKIIFQKILKIIFDKIFLILHSDNSKKLKLDYKNNFFIFILKG